MNMPKVQGEGGAKFVVIKLIVLPLVLPHYNHLIVFH